MPPSVQRLCVAGHDAGLHPRREPLRIEVHDPVHVLREIKNHGHVAALAGQARAAAARQHRRAEFAAGRQGGLHVGLVQRHHQADRHLPVVGGIGGVERARAAVEPHFTADHALQAPLEIVGRRKALARMGMRTGSRMELQRRNRHLSISSNLHHGGLRGNTENANTKPRRPVRLRAFGARRESPMKT
jgi:hypothetical protein